MESPGPEHLPASPEVVERLVRGHRDFLAFVESRVRDRALAEDILQAAFVKALERGGALRDGESAVAWFYRLLRNALVDHWRRVGAHARALEHEAALAEDAAPDPELERAICACMSTLLPTLKPEYAEMLRRVDLGGEPLGAVAGALGITVNNATVRIHRARRALKQQLERSCGTCTTHGCLDCTCGGPAREPPPAGGSW